MSDTSGSSENVRSLRDAIRQVRTASAERSDVVVELRDAERARLEMLADELKSVFAEIPEDNETFLFSVAGGTPPRLWIDMTAFVVMGRDPRTYRFLKDTRLGRTVILETTNLKDMADCITHYVAERIIERERAIEGDWLMKRVLRDEAGRREDARQAIAAATAAVTPPAAAPAVVTAGPRPPPDGRLGWGGAAFLFGLLIGAASLLAYAWVKVPPA
ncbi:MAG TPA: hypothetical protein PKA74_17900 [Bauldia sp.]|nr:hypothetical protein [Bauldia sp.]